jgi:formylglycine-generating enzyme required for sulfatase activity
LFMAPEQTESRSKVAPAADVWALGLLVFRALTGKHFWIAAHDESASMTALMRELVLNPIPPASERAREHGFEHELPAGFDGWFAECLQREAGARFADAGAAHDAFARVTSTDAGASIVEQELRAPRRETASVESPVRTEQRGETEIGGAAEEPEKTLARGDTEIATAVSNQVLAPRTVMAEPLAEDVRSSAHANRTVAAAPLESPKIPARPLAVARQSETSKSRTGLIVGAAAAAVVVAGGYMLTRKSNAPVESPPASARANVDASASAERAVALQANRFVDIASPNAPVPLGVAADAKPSTRGLRPAHNFVSPREPYAIHEHEVTWAEMDPWLEANDLLRFDPPADVPKDKAARRNLPATGVPWEIARDFCQALGGDLPTEEQWEFAARGSALRSYPWGNAPSRTHAFVGPTGRVVSVMTGQDVTPEGVHDLMGNAREWTLSHWREDVSGRDGSGLGGGGGMPSARAVRGWPLRADAPPDFSGIFATYRDYACADGGCSPKQPDLNTKLSLLPFAVARVAPTPASPLRAWVNGPLFSDTLGHCAREAKSSDPFEWKLQAELKVESCAKGTQHGLYIVPSEGDAGAIVFVQKRKDSSDLDGDGISDMADKCPNDPEDKDNYEDDDGCPDPDNDHDGIVDAVDRCPSQPETKNGFEDSDGCPDVFSAPPTAEKQPEKAPTPEVKPPAAPGCRATHELLLSSKDMPPEVVKCLQRAADLIPTGAQAWTDEVTLQVSRTAVPAMLAETGFRCVKRR